MADIKISQLPVATVVNDADVVVLNQAGVTKQAARSLVNTPTGTLPVANGGTGVTASSGANSVVLRDSSQNITANSIIEGFTSVAASGTQITLTVASVPSFLVTGSGGQVIQLPNATTLQNGIVYLFNNNQSSGAISVNNNSGTLVASIPSGGFAAVSLLSNASAAGSWERHEQAPSNVTWSTNTLDYPGSITGATWNGNAVAVNRGGTGQSTFADGQLLIGSTTGNTLAKGTLTSGNGIAITNGAGTISLAADFGSIATKVTEGGTTVLKTGDTMTGKLVLGPSGASAPLNLGANVNPTVVNGDVWLASGNNALTWRGNNGATYPAASTVAINSFTAAQGISASTGGAVLGVTQTTGAGTCITAIQNATGTGSGISVDLNNTSSTAAAVRITNLGTGDCLRVEDSTTPDATPFVVNAAGRVGVGLAADSVAAANLDSGGIKLNNAGATLSATISVGSGSPEGVVTANPGSLYLNLSGGANTSLYVKETGTSNTGWAGK